jgi:hypothetical protein
MKCPYQTKVIHKPEYTEGYEIKFAMDITEFGECVKSECPFYHTTEYKPTRHIKEHCRKAESEGER